MFLSLFYIICKNACVRLPVLTEVAGCGLVASSVAVSVSDEAFACLPGGTSYSGYEAAVYSAASSYYQQQQQQQKQAAAAAAAAAATAAWTGTTFTKKAPFQNKQLKPKQPPKPPQIHYCDVCKISCAGPQVQVRCGWSRNSRISKEGFHLPLRQRSASTHSSLKGRF